MNGPTTTREQRLAWTPEQAFTWMEAAGVDEIGTVAMAFAEQLEAAEVPPDALAQCVACWSHAQDGLSMDDIPAERLQKLDQDLESAAGSLPALSRWMAALRGPVYTAKDLDWVVQFLEQTRSTWTASRWVKTSPAARAGRARHEPPQTSHESNVAMGPGIANGAFVITEKIAGMRARGLYRAIKAGDASGKRYLVTMGSRQKRSLSARAEELAFAVAGVEPLELIGRVDDDQGVYHALVEQEPAGVPTTQLPLPLSPEATVDLAVQVSQILERIHAEGQVVGYLRPELIYVDPSDNAVKLTGVGVRTEGFLADVVPPSYGVPPLFQTVYSSPEVVSGADNIGPATDVFSLSAIVGFWLTGEHPFVGETPMEQMAAIWQGRGRPWKGPSALGLILSDGMETDPAARPPLAKLMRRLQAGVRPA